ncbi:MAG: hypothetical protein UX04_C0003G0029 [Microgenomates group bacterium GW2011_GWF2_45_18]|nr:MAG: hypothetical protein UW18_C0002G0029 [Microgenomates group bacterium GW2011_GWF1_44_10]KKU01757.1 MAG: hypothetical protein UX04_C0003G0029 [Microgenomates group bacterium GW2011_GWF2_45_18]OGJ41580.1 MAG: ribonuclease III [Candidatus Pacebacteria bacterium RIFOXYB1_FULL_44_10]HAU98939.1 ribonuclease III [Candidatus Paceibacterota bacterium]HAX01104.1 ribonuclease III [Candidatus Paceibacterota bacterium]
MTPTLPDIHSPLLQNQVWIHRSALNETAEVEESNERLEFLGDAVLELACSRYLFEQFPQEPEGMLTALRSSLVKTTTLADMARKFEMGQLIHMSKGEEKTGGRENASILADTFEAFLGALYLDQGFEPVDAFLRDCLFPLASEIRALRLEKDDKSMLQEYLQARKLPLPVYKVIREEGMEHQKTFTMTVEVGKEVFAQETGRNKQEAQQRCARKALEKLTQHDTPSLHLDQKESLE